jgi:hypothetical protein
VRRSVLVCGLLIVFVLAAASCSPRTAPLSEPSPPKARVDVAALRAKSPYQHQDTWYEFMLKQFNPDNVDYGRWIEQERRKLFNLLLNNPYFLYSSSITVALLLAATACAKQWVDHRRAMWVTAEMMADLYNQDAYSRQIAREAIERFNKHIERCNRAIEQGETNAGSAAGNSETEQLRTELMQVAEERDRATRDRDVAREELRRKSEILADMSVRLDAAAGKAGATGTARTASDVRGADARLVTHINNLQEQLYSERNSNRRLKGG